MKFILIIISFLFIQISTSAQNNILENKKYSIIVNEACRSFKDGGCLITTYNILTFNKDSVYVNAYTKADCEIKERNEYYSEDISSVGKYSYQIHKKKGSSNYFIRIHGYLFELLEIFPDYLIELNSDHTTNPDHIFKLIM